MRVLLDTHALLFWVYEPGRLGASARRHLSDREHVVYWSVASSWEIAIKVGLGKLRLDGPPEVVVPEELGRNGFTLLPIDHEDALAVADLPHHHGDPFDRLLVCQARSHGLALVSGDTKLAAYGVPMVW